MRWFHRQSILLWLLLRSIPPISVGRLLMPVVFLSVWTVLRVFGQDAPHAFVWAAVLAQALHVWAVQPVTVRHQRRLFGRAGGATAAGLALMLVAMAVQIWWADPAVSQRIVTVFCAFYIGAMLAGIRGDPVFLERFAPVADPAAVPKTARIHLLKLRALVAVMVIVVNETLLVMAAPLGARATVLALLPIALHVFYQLALVLTLPLEDET